MTFVNRVDNREEVIQMFRMLFSINTNKMVQDGLGDKYEELETAVKSIDSYIVETNKKDEDGNLLQELSTSKFGDESFLISLLEDMPWFMKYVTRWETDDNGLRSNMIDVEREMGFECSYAG